MSGGSYGRPTHSRMAHAIKLYMVSREVTQASVAKQIGITPWVLSRYLTGSDVVTSHQKTAIFEWLLQSED